jgi:hypothetical protein
LPKLNIHYRMEQKYRTPGYSQDILFAAYEQRNASWILIKKQKLLSSTAELLRDKKGTYKIQLRALKLPVLYFKGII